MSRDRSLEAAAIFGSHGVADGVTTALAAVVVGSAGEGNPIVRSALEASVWGATALMLVGAGLAAIAWPTAADAVDAPEWVGATIAAVGIVVALGNLAVVATVGWSA